MRPPRVSTVIQWYSDGRFDAERVKPQILARSDRRDKLIRSKPTWKRPRLVRMRLCSQGAFK
jgi:hypothetical protein